MDREIMKDFIFIKYKFNNLYLNNFKKYLRLINKKETFYIVFSLIYLIVFRSWILTVVVSLSGNL